MKMSPNSSKLKKLLEGWARGVNSSLESFDGGPLSTPPCDRVATELLTGCDRFATELRQSCDRGRATVACATYFSGKASDFGRACVYTEDGHNPRLAIASITIKIPHLLRHQV